MIYRFCGLDLQMSGKWRRSARGEFYREELRERERETKKDPTKNSSAGANGAYPHLFGLHLAEKLFGRSLAEKASFGHRWAENGPVRPPSSRSYYFRPGSRQQ